MKLFGLHFLKKNVFFIQTTDCILRSYNDFRKQADRVLRFKVVGVLFI